MTRESGREAPGTGEAGRCPQCGGVHGGPCPAEGGRTLAFGSLSPALTPTPATDPLVGATVGSFRLVRILGRGGMGTVYLGEHPVIGSKVAVKFLHETMAGDGQVVQRFYDEARAVNLIGHENIVGVYDLSILPPQRYYYVMEYLDGETLSALARRGAVSPALAVDVLLQLCDALQCAHERGVVHRDLKPDNVFLVSRRGNPHFVKLVDFGIAKLRTAGTSGGRTAAGLIVGTPEYMSPEQCDDGRVDARADVYALGIMAFELFTGRLPFQGTVTQLLLAHLQKPPPRPSSLAPVGPVLEAAVLRALEKEPERRFADMNAFAAALREARAELERSTLPPPDADLPAPAAARAVAPPLPPPDPPEPPAAEAPPPSPFADVVVELAAGDGAPRTFPVAELTRGGLYLLAEGDLPPLFARVTLALSHPSLRAPLALQAEVVRHVAPREAAGANLPPGFALQLVSLAPADRAALTALADGARPPPPPSRAGREPNAGARVDARLGELEARSPGGPYAVLGVAPDAEFHELRMAARALREELEALRARPLAPAHPARATALLSRVDVAQSAVGAPAARLAHDARSGNWRGVRRCLAAGVPETLVWARRREILEADPLRAPEAARQLARAQVARKLGNVAAARQAWEAALAADPLDLAALEAYVAFRRDHPDAA